MKDQIKASICSYLKEKFENLPVATNYDFDRGAETFLIKNSSGRYILKLDENLLEDLEVNGIAAALEQHNVAKLMKDNSGNAIYVDHSSCKVIQLI